jgi:hypothetical protein
VWEEGGEEAVASSEKEAIWKENLKQLEEIAEGAGQFT